MQSLGWSIRYNSELNTSRFYTNIEGSKRCRHTFRHVERSGCVPPLAACVPGRPVGTEGWRVGFVKTS